MAALKAAAVISVLVPSVHTPVINTVSAVRVHMIKVSTNTSKDASNPCRTGSLVLADAWNTAAVPVPASLEYAPLESP